MAIIARVLAFLCFLAFCAAFFFYYWSGGLIANSATDMLATANGFLDDVGGSRLESAYARTSERFRKEHTPEQFRALIDNTPLLKSPSSRQIKDYQVAATWTRGTASFHAVLQLARESQPVELGLVTEEAVWKVDDLRAAAK